MIKIASAGELGAVCAPGASLGQVTQEDRAALALAAGTKRGEEAGRGEEGSRDPGLKQRKRAAPKGVGAASGWGRRKAKAAGERLDSQNLEVEVLMLMVELGVGAGTALATAAAASQLFNIMITPLGSGGGGGPNGSPSLGPFLSTETAGTASSCPRGGSRTGAGIDEGGGGGCRKPSTAVSQLLWFWSSIIAS